MFTLILCRLESCFHPVPDQLFFYFSAPLNLGHLCVIIFWLSSNHFFPTQPNYSYHCAARWPWRKLFVWFFILLSAKQKNICWYFSQFTSIVAKSRSYWSLRTLLSVDYANMWRLLTKLSLFWQTFVRFDLKLVWLKKIEERELIKSVIRAVVMVWNDSNVYEAWKGASFAWQ